MTTPVLRLGLSSLVYLFTAVAAAARDATPTNVVFILTDNHGAWTLGCYGNADIQTPRIDGMAARGTRFVNAFANNPVCSPTRASYLTGLMPSQHGVHSYLTGGGLQTGEGTMRNTLEEFTSLPEILRKNGYACGLVGKWHLGNNLSPNEGLDDCWITMPHGGTSTFHGARIVEHGRVREEPEYLTTFWTKRALDFIEQKADAARKGRPFFLYLAYNGPYGLSRYQLQPSGNRWAAHYANRDLPSFPRGTIHPWQHPNREYFGNPVSIRRYAEELSAIDDGVGAVLDKLEAEGLAKDTLVVFAADQGWAGGQHGLWGMGDHTRPVNAREHSMRIPLIFHQPGGVAEGQAPEQMVSNVDFLPSVLGYLGLGDQLPRKPTPPGRDFSPLLRGEAAEKWDDTIFYEYETLRCVRTREWKYVERLGEGYDEFYRIDEDPGESHNLLRQPGGLSPEAQAALDQMKSRLAAFFTEHSLPKYDLWKGGGSQARLHTMADAAEPKKGAQAASAAPAIAPDFDPPQFELPDGLVAEVAAGPPLVQHPVMAAFDDRGRLFVSENAGLNLNKAELEQQKPNSVKMLVDSDNDGLFDRGTIFADRMTFPQGALWHLGALYVMSPPSLWRLEDTDEDGVADVREELVTGLDYTGNAADVHGPFLHPDGRIFWCHGRKGHEVRDPKSGELISKNKGARIWSCKPDGSDVQVFAGGGMDNPVEIDFTDTGEILGTVNLFHGRPRGDTLVHWLRGGAYPREDQEAVVAEFVRTGPLLPEVHNFGHVAVSGMTIYRTGKLNPDWKNNVLVTHFNTQTITRSVLETSAATFRHVKTETILKLASPDSHITDVFEDPNGDILVVDTGGWFRIGCPTWQVTKPEVPGAIYRVRKAGLPDREGDAFGNRFAWEKATAESIAKKLDHPSFSVRERARTELAVLGEPAIPELEAILSAPEAHTETARRNAVWTLARMRFADAADLLLSALADPSVSVRQAACQAIASTRDWRTVAANLPAEGKIEIERNRRLVSALIEQLRTASDAALRRSAAEALGRMGDSAAVGPLLAVAGRETTDRSLEHAAIFALIQIGDVKATRDGFSSGDSPRSRAAALVALDQMAAADDPLDPLAVLPLLDAADEKLRGTAGWLASRHPEWDAAVANRFHEWLDAGTLNEHRHEAFAMLAPRFFPTPPMQSLIGSALAAEDANVRRAAFQAIAAANQPGYHESWRPAFAAVLEKGDEDLTDLALKALAKTDSREFDRPLGLLANNDAAPPLRRVLALRAMGKPNAAPGEAAFRLLARLAGPEASPLERLEAAQLLGAARLTPPQLIELAALVRHAGPMDLPFLLRAFEKTKDAEAGRALAAALPGSPGVGNANPSELTQLFTRFPPEVADLIKPVVQALNDRKNQQAHRLAEIEASLAGGDASRGKAAFLAGKGACVTCHQIGTDGRAVGPNLSTIGQIRTGRDLLEAVLYPSESIARDFETFQITLKDGNVQLGLIQRETGDTVYVTNAAGEVIPLARSAVASIVPVPMSLMPQGLDQALSRQELVDLVAFLKAGAVVPEASGK